MPIASTRVVGRTGTIRIPSTQISVHIASIKQASTLVFQYYFTSLIAATGVDAYIGSIKRPLFLVQYGLALPFCLN